MPKLALASTIGWGFPTWREDEEIALLAAFGIRRVQVFRNAAKTISALDIRRQLAASGIQATSLHGFFGEAWDPSQTDEAARRRAVEGFTGEADFCLALGGTFIVVHPGSTVIGPETRSPARLAALSRSAAELARLGEKTGLRFLLENLPPGQMGDDMAMLRRLVDEIDCPLLGLNYDCGHANMTTDPITVIRQGGQRIASVHIHDNSGQTDDHLVPESGNIDMDAMCRELAGVGYRGEFLLELMETSESLRKKCDAAWWAKLNRWIDLAGGLIS
jgi:hexosaminidase